MSTAAGARRAPPEPQLWCSVPDDRGVVYLEFLFAFVPLFLLFLATCQFALLHTAKLVVHHAAFAAARSAIVVLAEDPQDHGGAGRGVLSSGRAEAQQGIDGMLVRFSLLAPSAAGLPAATGVGGVFGFLATVTNGPSKRQQGARMAPIRAAAYMPLLALGPASSRRTLAGSVDAGITSELSGVVDYTKAASVITVQAGPGSADLAHEPIDAHASVTLRVTYVYQCNVPLVRALMCSSLDSLLPKKAGPGLLGLTFWVQPSKLGDRLQLAESSGLDQLVPVDARVVVFDAEATLPNQGAGYEKDAG